jgi:hypothetical protein
MTLRCTYCPFPAVCRTAELAFEELLCADCCPQHGGRETPHTAHTDAEGVAL